MLMSLGFDVAEIDSDDSSSESESDPDVEVENHLILQQSLTKTVPTHHYCENEEELDTVTALFQKCKTHKLLSCLKDNHFNWISFVDTLKTEEPSITPQDLADFASQLPDVIPSNELELFKQSYQVFLDKQEEDAHGNNNVNDDEIVSESEDDNPEEWVGIEDLLQEPGKCLLQQKIQAVRRNVSGKLRRRLLKNDCYQGNEANMLEPFFTHQTAFRKDVQEEVCIWDGGTNVCSP